MKSPAAPRKKRSITKALGGFVLLIAILFGFSEATVFLWTRLDQWRFPWGYPASGRPTLVGTWVGTLVTGGGARRGLLVEIRMVPAVITSRRGRTRVRRERESKLEGDVRLCAAPGEVQRFTAHGDTEDDRAASRFYLGLSVADSVPRDGLAPSHLRGQWSGDDSLAFEADVHMRKGQAAISSTDDPDTGRPATAAMRRGTEAEFRALCGSLG